MWAPPPNFLHCSQGHDVPEPGSSFCLQESRQKAHIRGILVGLDGCLILGFSRGETQGGRWAVVKWKQLPRELTRMYPLSNLKHMASLFEQSESTQVG